jgi:hypothetical protein
LVVWNIFYDFPYIGNNPNWLFFRGVETTNQLILPYLALEGHILDDLDGLAGAP